MLRGAWPLAPLDLGGGRSATDKIPHRAVFAEACEHPSPSGFIGGLPDLATRENWRLTFPAGMSPESRGAHQFQWPFGSAQPMECHPPRPQRCRSRRPSRKDVLPQLDRTMAPFPDEVFWFYLTAGFFSADLTKDEPSNSVRATQTASKSLLLPFYYLCQKFSININYLNYKNFQQHKWENMKKDNIFCAHARGGGEVRPAVQHNISSARSKPETLFISRTVSSRNDSVTPAPRAHQR